MWVGAKSDFKAFLFFFNACILSILSFETINKLKLFFECCIPRPQDEGKKSK
jgi:hypothetical protein